MKDEYVFDFGFTIVTEDELEVVQEVKAGQKNASANALKYADELQALRAAIQPLLNNLRVNPEKDYIYWPDRLEKVDAFEAYIDKIYEG